MDMFFNRIDYYGLFGWDRVKPSDTEALLTASEIDAMIIHQETGRLAVALPKGDSILPQKVCNALSLYIVSQKIPMRFSWHFFPKQFIIFSPNITHLLYVLIYTRLQIFIQLSPTVTKLCHIKCDHLVYMICSKCPQSEKCRKIKGRRISLLTLYCTNNVPLGWVSWGHLDHKKILLQNF